MQDWVGLAEYNVRIMRRIYKTIRTVVVMAVGFPLVILGVILIPLPGPGILVSLLGLFVLSLEFSWAQKNLDFTKQKLKKIYQEAKAVGDRIEKGGKK